MVIGEALNRVAMNYGDKLAIRDEYGKHFACGTSLSYRELAENANRLANSFLGLGLRPGDRVAVQTGTGIGHALCLVGLANAGLAVAPIDRSFTATETLYQLQDSRARALVIDDDLYEDRLADIADELPVEFVVGIGGRGAGTHDFEALLQAGSPAAPGVAVGEDDVATLIYTSGTTGRPKGTPLTHRNWLFSAHIWAAELGVHPYMRWLLLMPTHSSGGTGLTLVSVVRGCSLYLCPPDPPLALGLIDQEGINFTQFSPTLLANLVRHPAARATDFSSIERWFTSAAPISAELLTEGATFLGQKFTQLYGTTETALWGTVLRPQEVELEGPLARRLTSIGRACLGYRTKVVDDAGLEVQPGGVGELAVSGGGVSKGYWNRPEATDFRDGWWYSGDTVRIDEDGYYYVVDRKKDMILSGGLNVYPREVEEVIAMHPAVNLVAVIGVPDPKWGEAVKAVVVLRDGATVTEEKLIEHARDRLAPYKAPKSVDFITLSEMPLLGGGYKVLKRELRDRYRRQAAGETGDATKAWGAV
jgi:acyl-CoA synthetase (AMP-forming)/AMP-acid ligase II